MSRTGALLSTTATLLVACAELSKDKKVLVIGIDGVRPDVLAEVSTPNIDRLIAAGAYSGQIETPAPTWSGPTWSSMLTGVWPQKHGVTSNDFTGNDYASYPDFLTRLEMVDPDFSTLALVDWPPLGTETDGGPLISDTIDVKLNFNGEEMGYEIADSQAVAAAVRILSNQDPDAAFVYIGNPDVAAHDNGVGPDYYRAIATADAQVGQLFEAIRGRATYAEEDWLILISTDHGHKVEGGHGGRTPEEVTIFYLASGPSAHRGALGAGANQVDIAVTALAHLGVDIDSEWGLDGRIAGLADHR